ncbi:hypothetical protein N7532_010224 [Penicillium argentinense]|uniref:J domain-containing protein n=1 Tax=Penicillium argentinense TaxID=1131581 RepID=A0A9W9JXQ8_9EURO|nr:uncharacterized protein N7532_010224 [Penicillium argentinense]KAJ5085453.1 hypothetical protein N7532_010224 [Penicillium argentinense]
MHPYAALGVAKEASLTEIRAAHRKRVLKCHPDKIQDESQRIAAQDEFQRVQQAYELLSDDTRRARYDQKVKLEALKRELMERRRAEAANAYASPRGSGSSGGPREMRNGHIVEERVPVEVFLDEAMRFTDEPNPMGRKHEEFGRRTKTKPPDDRKKSRTPTSSYRTAAKDQRESAKASHADRAKNRDRERRREASTKYEQFESYTYSPRMPPSDSDSESSESEIEYVRLHKAGSSRRSRESRSRPTESSSRRRNAYYDDDDDDYDDRYDSKHDYQTKQQQAEAHIQRSKYEVDPRSRASRSPPRRRGYESTEPESSSSRRAGRSSRTTQTRSSSRNGSYEHLESSRDYFKPPKMPASSSSPGYKSSIRPSIFTRAATASGFTRTKRESSSRGESTLDKMASEPIPRSSKVRQESGHSSSSAAENTRTSSPKVSARYRIDPEMVVIEPLKSKYPSSPDARDRDRDRDRGDRDRSSRMMPKRASTYAEPSRIEIRSVQPSRTYTNVEYSRPFDRSNVKYAREIRPSDASYSPARHSAAYYDEHRHPPPGRRQSATA